MFLTLHTWLHERLPCSLSSCSAMLWRASAFCSLQVDGVPGRFTGIHALMSYHTVWSWDAHCLLCSWGGIGLRCTGRAQGVLDHTCQAGRAGDQPLYCIGGALAGLSLSLGLQMWNIHITQLAGRLSLLPSIVQDGGIACPQDRGKTEAMAASKM